MIYYGFVYCWTNIENNMKYIGSHHGKTDDGYIGSGTYFIRAYNKEPTKFVREILEYNTYKDDPYITYSLEQKYLDTIADIHLNENYYNLTPNAFAPGGWSRGKNLSDIHKKNIGKSNKGKKRSAEQIKLWQEKMKMLELVPWNKGLTGAQSHSNETKEILAKATKYRHANTDMTETYKKIAESKLGKTKENDIGRSITAKKLLGNQNGANRKNTPKGKIWINKNGQSKMIHKSDLESYKDWNKGRK